MSCNLHQNSFLRLTPDFNDILDHKQKLGKQSLQTGFYSVLLRNLQIFKDIVVEITLVVA